MSVHVCGIDFGKNVFHLIGLDESCHILLKKRFTRKQLVLHLAKMTSCPIEMEACSGGHFLARTLVAQGHQVRLMPAQYVKPYVSASANAAILICGGSSFMEPVPCSPVKNARDTPSAAG